LITYTSSAPAAPKVRSSEPRYDDIVNPYPTHANYATMMDDHKKVIDNNLLTAVNMIMARFDKLEGKQPMAMRRVLILLLNNLNLACLRIFMIIKVYMQQQIKANRSLQRLKSIRPV
jgi:hypothetical protein